MSFETMVQHDGTAKTDDQGHFTFARVAPGTAWIGPAQSQSRLFANAEPALLRKRIEVAAGARATVTLGGSGTSVTGHVATTQPSNDSLTFTGTLRPVPPGATTQTTMRGEPAGPFAYQVTTGPDGAFLAEDVPPGHYVFEFHAFYQAPGAMIGEQTGRVSGEFNVPAAAAPSRSAPSEDTAGTIDVGTFYATIFSKLSPGDPAPDFHARTADGKELKLKDFAGKHLVLQISRPNRPSVYQEDARDYGMLMDRFGGADGLAFLSINVGKPDAGAPPNHVAASAWQQAYVEDYAALSQHYANAPVPTFVIDPQGKIVTKWVTARGLLDVLGRSVTLRTASDNGMIVTVEHHDLSAATPEYKFDKVPSIMADDAGKNAAFAIVDNTIQEGSGGVGALNDGIGANNNNAPRAACFFAHGSLEGRIRADLGKALAIERVGTYSWHVNTRCPQVYRLYGSDGSATNFNPEPRNGTDPAACGWTRIADVDTRRKDGPAGGQDGVAITSAAGTLGTYRYLLFVTFVTETNDGWGHTFFNEIDVVEKK
jgi:hypothetical protein